mmetsp:Transcript_31743/g.77083  ORF Transcript_31743/g.77083 Transcript_31743/m.77083 type:complete len:251 (+) Transcript_31743:108-860(+)
MSRMQGRGRGRGGRNNSGRGNGRGYHQSFNSNNKKPKKKLEDCVFHLGTARQASDYDKCKAFIINYIREKFDGGLDMATALEELKNPIVEAWEPKATDYIAVEEDAEKKKQLDVILKAKYLRKLDIYERRKKEYHDNKTKAYGLIWGRCSPSMQSALESREDFERGIKNDPIGLLKAIKQHALNYREHRYEMSIIADALRTLLLSKRKEDEDLVAYTNRFRTAAEVLESHMGGPIILQNYVRNINIKLYK